MSSPFIAEIRIFPYTFAPQGWAFCNGQLLSISQNTALFALIGTYYGGDGKSTFALPNLQGSVAMHAGTGPGLSPRQIGETGGASSVTLLQSEIPMHTHTLQANPTPGNRTTPVANSIARVSGATPYQPPAGATLVPMNPGAVTPTGSSLPHNNMQPYLTFNYCIALQGIFPQRP